MRIKIKKINEISILAIDGEIILLNIDDIKDTFINLIEKEGVKKLILDFKDTDFIDSSGIGLIVEFTNKLRNLGGNFVIINLNNEIKNLLNIANLLEFLLTFKSENDAIDYLTNN
jgi:anti-anti-sigma factor